MWSGSFLVPVGRGRILDPISPETADGVMAWLHEVSESEPFGVTTIETPYYRRALRAVGPPAHSVRSR